MTNQTKGAPSGASEVLSTISDVLGPLSALYEYLRGLEKRNDEQFREERSQVMLEWLGELREADARQLATLGTVFQSVEALRAQLESLTSDPQFHRVRTNVGFEASREAIDERRHMLAHAAAGCLSPTLTVVQLARVERTIRELDPNDIWVLKALSMLSYDAGPPPVQPPGTPWTDELSKRVDAWWKRQRALFGNGYAIWSSRQPSGHLLQASGCVVLETRFQLSSQETFPVVGVTELGGWVLAVLDGYLRSKATTQPTPPRKAGG